MFVHLFVHVRIGRVIYVVVESDGSEGSEGIVIHMMMRIGI